MYLSYRYNNYYFKFHFEFLSMYNCTEVNNLDTLYGDLWYLQLGFNFNI